MVKPSIHWSSISGYSLPYATRNPAYTVPGFNAVPYINDFGVAAISALIGLMNIQMVTKLRDVFDQLFGIRKTDQDKGDDPGVAEESIKLSIESPEIEEGKDSFLIGVVKDDEGNPKKDLEVNFAIANTTYASFKENEDPRKITDSNGVAVQRFQALKKGNTLAIITAKEKIKIKNFMLMFLYLLIGTTT